MCDIGIREVETLKDRKKFVQFPFQLYQKSKIWIPPMIKGELSSINPNKNPSFKNSDVILFLAEKDNRVVGRIGGIINHKETERLGEKHARFYWIDFEDDLEITKALMEAVESWAKENEAILLKGPFGFSGLDKAGMLSDGFDEPSTLSTIYNYSYYPDHLKKLGYKKGVSWVEYRFPVPDKLSERVGRISKIVQKKYGLKCAEFKNRKEMVSYGDAVFDIFSESYKVLHGYTPITPKLKEKYINDYLKVLKKEFVSMVVGPNGNPVGFAVTMPSFAKAFQKARGKLYPFGILHIIRARRNNKEAELMLIGVKPEFQGKGVTTLLFEDVFQSVNKMGIKFVQAYPQLETNKKVLGLFDDYNPDLYRRRMSFVKKL